MDFAKILAAEFHIQPWQTEAVIRLLDEGNTLPIIARYRNEQHGELDDQKLRELSDRLEYLRSLDKRREQIQSAIDDQGTLTPELTAQLLQAQTLNWLRF